MRCTMCDEVGADCKLHGPPSSEQDAVAKFTHVRVENEVLRATVGALQEQLKKARRLVNESTFRRFFAEAYAVAKAGQDDLREATQDERMGGSAILIPVSMAMRRFEVIRNICDTALMDRGQ